MLADHAAPPRQPHSLDLRSPGWYIPFDAQSFRPPLTNPLAAPEKAEKEDETVDAPTAGEEAV